MSCGQNHKYDAYQTASDKLRTALVVALNSDEETSTLKELFEHFVGVRSIADKASYSFSITGGDSVIDFGSMAAATQSGVVDFDYSGIGTDTIFTTSDNDVFSIPDPEVTGSVDNITL